ncbi:MAG: hypothetical protein AAFQ85_12555 [Pseudomonadota bacterium]
MPKDSSPNPAPPSKPERDQLAAQRKGDISKPAPVPSPGSIGAAIDASKAKFKVDQAHERERRIKTIDQVLKAKEGKAREGFATVKDKGAAKAQANKARQEPGKSPVKRKQRGP